MGHTCVSQGRHGSTVESTKLSRGIWITWFHTSKSFWLNLETKNMVVNCSVKSPMWVWNARAPRAVVEVELPGLIWRCKLSQRRPVKSQSTSGDASTQLMGLAKLACNENTGYIYICMYDYICTCIYNMYYIYLYNICVLQCVKTNPWRGLIAEK
jgi:hypothetical protein